MGYMEGNLSGMDYSYGGTSTHYPLWKPPSGYFPRGEAPPPYEEAVAISQAEALSAQCTVSVATTTHRSLPVGINPVDISGDVVRRGQLAQPQQQHPSQTVVAQMQPQPSQHHQQSITQSTTNLINININSGGNLTTIATGESHQPPYGCIASVNQACSTQTPSNCSSAINGLSDVAAVANNARLHLPNNSICVQTTAPPLANNPAIHSAQTQQHYSQAQQQMQYQHRTQQQQLQLHQQQQQTQQHHLQSQSLQQTNCIQITECSYKNCHLNSSNRRIQKQHPTQEMIHYVSNANAGVSFQSISNERNDPESVTTNKPDQLTSPQYPTVDNNGGMQEISTITSSDNVAAQTSSLKTANKTPSSSRRYHRTIPRYFAVVDPLGQAAQQIPKPLPSTLSSSKSSSTNTATSTSTINANGTNSKKPTCQCPVQHVPMSYMGTNQINNSQTNNVFLSALSTKLVTNRTSFGTKIMPPSTPTTSSKSIGQSVVNEQATNGNNTGTMKRTSSSGTSNNNLNQQYCQHDTKIATISKQVGDLKTDAPTFETHALLQPFVPGIDSLNDDKVHSSFKGRTNTNQSKISSSPKLIPESTSLYSTGNLNTVPLNYPEANPALPPKMYKSQTNLKSPNATSATQLLMQKSPHHVVGLHSNDIANQIPTISHQKSQFSKSLPRKEDKNPPPALTLPVSGQLTAEKSQSLGKINSSTFYPLQNNHVTYTLPKHAPGKMSLNSTIASVVSKVPSVISIPVSDESNTPRLKSQPQSPNHRTNIVTPDNKCTTLPKTLRSVAKKTDAIPTSTGFSTAATTPTQSSSSCNNSKPLDSEKPLPVCTTSKNCLNPKEHFLPNDTSLDDDYLSECENCKIAHGSKYYLDEEIADSPQETMTLQRKMDDKEEQEQAYYRISHTLPTNPKKNPTIKNNTREPWFSTIPASSSSEEEINE